MKLCVASAVLSLLPSAASGQQVDHGTFRPLRLSYDSLLTKDVSDDQFIEALSKVGIISIQDVPGYASARKEALGVLHMCMMKSSATNDHKYQDGTIRRTIATHSVPGGMQKIKNIDDKAGQGQAPPDSKACKKFSETSDKLRSSVDTAIKAFSARLETSLDLHQPLLATQGGSFTFDTIGQVVDAGDHLEHFHTYQRTSNRHLKSMDTIDMHTDQGLFIAFTPGVIADKSSESTLYPEDGGFFVQLQDGTRALAAFEEDDLVFMLGDGAEQVMNAKVKPNGINVRAVPHSLTIPNHGNDNIRAWYGRMVLPPQDAVHQDHGVTYGELRRLMIDESVSDEPNSKALGLGCSSSLTARQIEETTCEAGTIYCWHRCMNHTDYFVSDDVCTAQGLRMDCVNPRGQVYLKGHGDYFPACTDSTEEATPYPKLPTYPRDDSICAHSKWEQFASDGNYDHSFDPTEGISRFMWTTVDNGKTVKARLAFNGIFGYLAFGLAGLPGSKKNGMHDASVIMALPGDDYSAQTGLDLDKEHTIEEYKIHPEGSAFRHWQDPVTSANTSSYEILSTDCFTAITFETESINGIPFNITGTDKVLWAGNADDYFAGYHGKNRSVFCIDWEHGAFFESEKGAGCDKQPASVDPEENGDGPDHTAKSNAAATGFDFVPLFFLAGLNGITLLTWLA